MPEPPPVGLITRYLFESPYLPGGALVLIAIIVGWTSLRDGRVRGQQAAGLLLLLAGAILAVGYAVTTSGEHARRVTLEFVDAIVAADSVAAFAVLAPDATLSIGKPTNPGFDVSELKSRIDDAVSRYAITENNITNLEWFAAESDEGIAHLACLTEVADGYGPTLTSWVVRVRRQADGTWRIRQLTFVSVNGQAASSGHLR